MDMATIIMHQCLVSMGLLPEDIASASPSCHPGMRLDHLPPLMQVFNIVIGKMVTAVLWTSPLGIASLIAASICRACDLGSTLGALGLWVVTVLLGLALQGGLVLPAALWGCTRNSPWATMKGFSQAIVLGFGTSSSSAALPVCILLTFHSKNISLCNSLQGQLCKQSLDCSDSSVTKFDNIAQ